MTIHVRDYIRGVGIGTGGKQPVSTARAQASLACFGPYAVIKTYGAHVPL